MKPWDNGYQCGALVSMGSFAMLDMQWWLGGVCFVAALGLMLMNAKQERAANE